MAGAVYIVLAMVGVASTPATPAPSRGTIVVVQASGEGTVTAGEMRSTLFAVAPVADGAPVLVARGGSRLEAASPTGAAVLPAPIPALAVRSAAGPRRSDRGETGLMAAAERLCTQFVGKPSARPG
ncbi:MAG TPA: hypothetical protein VGQ83_17525 [Polyangia bacterium]|jgi:hypothetical protein